MAVVWSCWVCPDITATAAVMRCVRDSLVPPAPPRRVSRENAGQKCFCASYRAGYHSQGRGLLRARPRGLGVSLLALFGFLVDTWHKKKNLPDDLALLESTFSRGRFNFFFRAPAPAFERLCSLLSDTLRILFCPGQGARLVINHATLHAHTHTYTHRGEKSTVSEGYARRVR